MLWEYEPQASVPTAFSSSLVNFDYQNVNSLFRAITTSTACASSVSPSSYTKTIFNQSARVFS